MSGFDENAWRAYLQRKEPSATIRRAKCADDPVPPGGAEIIDARDWSARQLRKRLKRLKRDDRPCPQLTGDDGGRAA